MLHEKRLEIKISNNLKKLNKKKKKIHVSNHNEMPVS